MGSHSIDSSPPVEINAQFFQLKDKMSTPPPPGVYVPAVLFLDQNEELDEESIKKHILRLAQV